MDLKKLLFQPLFKHPMTIVRICTGIGFLIQGANVFNSGFMEGHIAIFEGFYNLPAPEFLAYISKGGEFVIGLLLVLGLFTRAAALFLMINMAVATFHALGGDILSTENYQAQLSWFYLIIGFAIFINGTTKYSIDERLEEKWSSS